MRKYLFLSTAAALVLGGEALADGMNYNYVQGDVNLGQLSSGGESIDGTGFAIEGSGAIGEDLLVFGSAGTTKYEEGGESVRFNPISLGLGGRVALGSNLDLVGGASYERVKLSIPGFSIARGGWGLRAGLRGMAAEKFEWTAGLKYSHLEDLKQILDFTVGGHYYFTPAFAVGLDLTARKYDKDAVGSNLKETTAAIGFRYAFGSR